MLALAAPVVAAPFSEANTWARGSGLEIVLYVIGAALASRFATWLGHRVTRSIDARDRNTDALVSSENAKHRHAVTQVLTWIALVLIYSLTAVVVLQRFGIPVTGFVAPATVAGVALGFGAQRLVQDILAGFFIITERQYGFGDVISVYTAGIGSVARGTVEEVTLRITRVRSVDGEVFIIPNGQIAWVVNLSRDWARAVIDIPVPSTIDVNRATGILRRVGDEAYADDELKSLLLDTPSVTGVESFDVDEFHVRLVSRTLPGKQFDVGRQLRARIVAAFHEAGVSVTADLDTDSGSGATPDPTPPPGAGAVRGMS